MYCSKQNSVWNISVFKFKPIHWILRSNIAIYFSYDFSYNSVLVKPVPVYSLQITDRGVDPFTRLVTTYYLVLSFSVIFLYN